VLTAEVLCRLREFWWCQTDEMGHDIPLTGIDQLNAVGEAPIHIAARNGSAADIECLLASGADINQRGDFEMTPLHYAHMGGKPENILALLNAGADASLRCDRGLLPQDGRADTPPHAQD
jgi:ankyrin repeat protein